MHTRKGEKGNNKLSSLYYDRRPGEILLHHLVEAEAADGKME